MYVEHDVTITMPRPPPLNTTIRLLSIPKQMAGAQVGRASSLGAVGNVVGVAVGGVSQAVTSVATTAETGWVQ